MSTLSPSCDHAACFDPGSGRDMFRVFLEALSTHRAAFCSFFPHCYDNRKLLLEVVLQSCYLINLGTEWA